VRKLLLLLESVVKLPVLFITERRVLRDSSSILCRRLSWYEPAHDPGGERGGEERGGGRGGERGGERAFGGERSRIAAVGTTRILSWLLWPPKEAPLSSLLQQQPISVRR